MTIVVCTPAYGIAALIGALAARELCRGGTPFADGPRPVKVRTWIVAAAGAVLGAGVGLHGGSTWQLATLGLIVIALAACAVCDLTLGIVPDMFTLVPLAALIVSSALHHNFAPLLSAAMVALPFGGAALVTRGYGMGWGDVKLAALGGALLGAGGAMLAFVIGCLLAFVLSLVMRERGRPIPLAPYLIGGIGAVLMMGTTL